MSEAQAACWYDQDDGGPVLHLSGQWRLARLGPIDAGLAKLNLDAQRLIVDGSQLAMLDTAAAMTLLIRLTRSDNRPGTVSIRGFATHHQRVLELVRLRLSESSGGAVRVPRSTIGSLGYGAWQIATLIAGHVNFIGMIAVGFYSLLRHPRTLRLKEFTVQLEQACLSAIPVVSLATFLIGVVVAYLLCLQAEQYGVGIFVVDGVAMGLTREFSPVIVAVIVAGRSGAAFTAQLGSMRLAQEIDAIQTLGLSPLGVLVLPRVLALVAGLPLLVFVGDILSIAGAVLVTEPMLGITPVVFVSRLREELDPSHVMAGFIKAPVFAIAIAVIGCRMGMTAGRDTRAVGQATTSTVVQSIVSVIVLDAAFAVLFQQIGW
ncbi:MAG: ABC transporter permease [Burkholderiales bacterium]